MMRPKIEQELQLCVFFVYHFSNGGNCWSREVRKYNDQRAKIIIIIHVREMKRTSSVSPSDQSDEL